MQIIMTARIIGLFLWNLVIILLIAEALVNSPRDYEGGQVLRVKVSGGLAFKDFKNIITKIVTILDVWKDLDHETGTCDIYIQRHYIGAVIEALREHDLEYAVMIDDVAKLIEEELRDDRRYRRSKNSHRVVGHYPRYNEIVAWFERMANKHSDIAEVISIGSSYEGRDTKLLKIGVPPTSEKPKRKFFIDGTMHAREWIATSTVVFLTDKLLRGSADDSFVKEILRKFDIFLLPVANPDGYEYCHSAVNRRLWRKNRRPINGANCTGIDLNRNWAFKWGGEIGEGYSGPCGNIYPGNEAQSEPEVLNIVNFILPRASEFVGYLSYHAYAQVVFTRWDYDDVYPPDHEHLLDVAQKTAEAMKTTHGQNYSAGTAPLLMYKFSGGSADWARGVANITYAYLVELRDTGDRGFVLLPDQIIPTGEEAWAGLKVMFAEILNATDSAHDQLTSNGSIITFNCLSIIIRLLMIGATTTAQ